MEQDEIVEAARLTKAVTELLQRAAAIERRGQERAEVRYAEALARTLLDQLTAMDRSRSCAWPLLEHHVHLGAAG